MPEGPREAPDRVLVIAGPTAVGKSGLALRVAETTGAEIVSADSRQVFRRLDVGTAKPSLADRQRVRHHLVDVLDPRESYSSGQFRTDAMASVEDAQSRGRPVVVVGGSTLYVEALIGRMADLPPLPEALRQSLAEETRTPDGQRRLFDELAAADPEAAATLDPTKSHRLARLVGLLRHTGQQPSHLWREAQQSPVPHVLVVLDRPRPELYARINLRVDDMVADGLVEEVQRLYALGDAVRPVLRSTIGYQEIVAALEGERRLDDAIDLVKRNSRRYAKRQLTWYRRYPQALWLDARTATVASLLEAVAPWPRSRYSA